MAPVHVWSVYSSTEAAFVYIYSHEWLNDPEDQTKRKPETQWKDKILHSLLRTEPLYYAEDLISVIAAVIQLTYIQ